MIEKPISDKVNFKYDTNFILKDENKSNLFISFNTSLMNDKVVRDNITVFKNNTKTQFLNNFIALERNANQVLFHINLYGDFFNKEINNSNFSLNVFVEKYNFVKKKYDSITNKINMSEGLLNFNHTLNENCDINLIKIKYCLNRNDYSVRDALLPAGIKNKGSSCYLNTIVQILYSFGFIKKIVNDYENDELNMTASSFFMKELKILFYKIKHSKSVIDASAFYETLLPHYGHYEENVQHDIHEFFLKFIEYIKEYDKNNVISNNTQIVVDYQMKEKSSREITSCSQEEFIFLSLDLFKETFDIEECFDHYFKNEEIEEYEHKGKICEAIKIGNVSKYPKLLFLHLKRFMFNKNDSSFEKCNNKVSFSDDLVIKHFNNKSYSLHSIIIHEGDLTSGHYFCYIKKQDNEKKDYWIKCNDSKINKVTNPIEIYDMNYGGNIFKLDSFVDNQLPEVVVSYKEIITQSNRNAYILVYREEFTDFLFELENEIKIEKPECLSSIIKNKKQPDSFEKYRMESMIDISNIINSTELCGLPLKEEENSISNSKNNEASLKIEKELENNEIIDIINNCSCDESSSDFVENNNNICHKSKSISKDSLRKYNSMILYYYNNSITLYENSLYYYNLRNANKDVRGINVFNSVNELFQNKFLNINWQNICFLSCNLGILTKVIHDNYSIYNDLIIRKIDKVNVSVIELEVYNKSVMKSKDKQKVEENSVYIATYEIDFVTINSNDEINIKNNKDDLTKFKPNLIIVTKNEFIDKLNNIEKINEKIRQLNEPNIKMSYLVDLSHLRRIYNSKNLKELSLIPFDQDCIVNIINKLKSNIKSNESSSLLLNILIIKE